MQYLRTLKLEHLQYHRTQVNRLLWAHEVILGILMKSVLCFLDRENVKTSTYYCEFNPSVLTDGLHSKMLAHFIYVCHSESDFRAVLIRT